LLVDGGEAAMCLLRKQRQTLSLSSAFGTYQRTGENLLVLINSSGEWLGE
jgi:hypothetical protein